MRKKTKGNYIMMMGLTFVLGAVLFFILEVSSQYRMLPFPLFFVGLALLGYGSSFKRKKKKGKEE